MKKLIFVLLGCICFNLNFGQCSCCGSSSNISGGEATPTAYSLNKRQLVVELYSDYRTFTGNSTVNTIDHQISSAVNLKNVVVGGIGLRYGINNKTTLVIQQPYIFVNASTTSSNAFGDLLSLINYRLFSKSNFIIGLQAGIKWPTGQYILSGNGNSISTGSGSVDPVAGFSMIKAFRKSNVRAITFFKYATTGFNKVNYGDFFAHQFVYNYFVLSPLNSCVVDSMPQKKADGISLSINTQIYGEWLQAQTKDHAMLTNTGGYISLVGVGLTFGFKGLTIPILISVPIYQQFYGNQDQNTLRLRVGLTKTFN